MTNIEKIRDSFECVLINKFFKFNIGSEHFKSMENIYTVLKCHLIKKASDIVINDEMLRLREVFTSNNEGMKIKYLTNETNEEWFYSPKNALHSINETLKDKNTIWNYEEYWEKYQIITLSHYITTLFEESKILKIN